MQTTLTQRKPARRAPAADAKLPFPDLPESDDRLFWLACLFRQLAELQALDLLTQELHRRRRPDVVLFALYNAMGNMRSDLKTAHGYVVKGGLLPFAFAGTTVFNVQQVAA